jgi:selenocysteine lyase/cysteine desulfurase
MIVGVDEQVPVLGGGTRPYVNLDNAASTPALRPVVDEMTEFLKWYSNVHRGTGFKSKVSSGLFERARDKVAAFVGGGQPGRTVMFTKNTTESVNLLASRFPFRTDGVVLSSVMEHHSNDLPWRRFAKVVHARVLPDGRIDEEDLQRLLKLHEGHVQIVALTGASNVTGLINPIHRYARWAHEAGAEIFVDAAQLAPHRPIDMKNPGDDDAIDFLAFSAHKMYAPFGTGVLVGKEAPFREGDPFLIGGGTVDIVSLEHAYWRSLPFKEEAGTPGIVGAVALGSVLEFYEELGWDWIIEHESALTRRALELLGGIPRLVIYGDRDPLHSRDRLGVIPMNIEGLTHGFLSSVLSQEWGIGTRDGCFCAHPYVKEMLCVDEAGATEVEKQILQGDRTNLPGMVRASFGIYNTLDEVERLAEALTSVASGRYRDGYVLDTRSGEYQHGDWDDVVKRFVDESGVLDRVP